MVKSYFDADLVSMTDALASPLKRSVSLEGQMTNVTLSYNMFNTVVIVIY